MNLFDPNPLSALEFLPAGHDLSSLQEAAAKCRGCDLYREATQVVFGEGRAQASILMVGEQPGDREDREGKPFVGPAGQLLDKCLQSAGIDRPEVYITNAVKHFKWEPRGKRRLHKKPNVSEIRACNIWLVEEIAAIKPRVIVALGATALSALVGSSYSIEAARKVDLAHSGGAKVLASYHPSAILRADDGRKDELRAFLIADLKRAVTLAAK
jgi:uracil-DNA glycosylase